MYLALPCEKPTISTHRLATRVSRVDSPRLVSILTYSISARYVQLSSLLFTYCPARSLDLQSNIDHATLNMPCDAIRARVPCINDVTIRHSATMECWDYHLRKNAIAMRSKAWPAHLQTQPLEAKVLDGTSSQDGISVSASFAGGSARTAASLSSGFC